MASSLRSELVTKRLFVQLFFFFFFFFFSFFFSFPLPLCFSLALLPTNSFFQESGGAKGLIFEESTAKSKSELSEPKGSKLQCLYVDMQEHFSVDNSFSREVMRALFPPEQNRASFMVPALFEHLAKLPLCSAAKKRLDVVAEQYRPVFAMACNLLKELGTWASVFVAFGAAQDAPMTQDVCSHLREVCHTVLDVFDASNAKDQFLPGEGLNAARSLLAYLDTHRSGFYQRKEKREKKKRTRKK